MTLVIKIKRAYEEPSANDGYRILVDRLWPRGLAKSTVPYDEWLKELAPSAELRKWFGHDPERWPEFRKRYEAELKRNEVIDTFIEKHRDKKRITLIYGAADTEHNHAVVLQQYLDHRYISPKT